MENKYNIDDVNAWLKEEYGMSYDELSKEFNKSVDLLSESLKQRKEMRDKIKKANQLLKETEYQPAYLDCKYCELDVFNKIEDILKEDK